MEKARIVTTVVGHRSLPGLDKRCTRATDPYFNFEDKQMDRTAQWQPTTDTLLNTGEHLAPQTQVIRALQLLLEEVPCFATEKRHDCAEPCKWRRDCRGMVATWLR